ncbi:hypothetical protein [Arthrobacter sp. UYCu712]|uniref:hypothetical protein n=1 Tax=Arthrobacter sp. UYCu712 TaxID=3156340 RepID=UPI0033954B66
MEIFPLTAPSNTRRVVDLSHTIAEGVKTARSITKEKNQMRDTWFTVEDNNRKIFSTDQVQVTFRKDPEVGRLWTMSHAQLAGLQSAIVAYFGMAE